MTEERILQISNEISEGITSNRRDQITKKEFCEVVGYWQIKAADAACEQQLFRSALGMKLLELSAIALSPGVVQKLSEALGRVTTAELGSDAQERRL